MAPRSPGLPGVAVAVVAAGGVLLVAGFRNATVSDTLRGILKGQLPDPRPQATKLGAAVGAMASQAAAAAAGAAVGGAIGATGSAIADDAKRYLGIPYRFGGHDPSTGMDCSGFVTYVLHHDLGVNLPNNTHTVTGQFLVWGGAQTIPRANCAAGDLVCWGGHIGIAVSNSQMIHAPQTGDVVKISNIWNVPPPTIRRVAQATTAFRGGAKLS